MRKRLKSKRACGLCKPHKRRWVNRWKGRDEVLLREFEQDRYRYGLD